VDEVFPVSGSVGVALDSSISLHFSEPMKKRTVETGVVVSPPCRWKKRYWDGGAYYLIPENSLRSNTTYLLSVSNKVEDSHGIAMKSTFVSGFSTGDSLDAGLVGGTVRWKRLDIEGAVVSLFAVDEAETTGVPPSAEPVYVTLSGPEGKYGVPFVATSREYTVFSFIDKDLDAEYDDDELQGCYNGTVTFEEGPEARGIDIVICGETLRGGIAGRVDTASIADTITVAVAAASLEDSSLVYQVKPGKDGRFTIQCVQPGRYLIEVYWDKDSNLKRDEQDSILVELPDTIGVQSCMTPPDVEIIFDHEN
jgi:hypothetical protein